MTDTTVESRRCGALLGLAVGDALGTTNEFASAKTPGFGELITGPLTTIAGGGPFGVIAGQVTDDTQMACCLYSSLSDLGRFDLGDVAARYVSWSKYAFDVGTQISGVLSLITAGHAPATAGAKWWNDRDKYPAANGSLMRTTPIGAVLSTIEEIRAAALADSAITHFDPKCRLSCATFDAAISFAIAGGERADMLSAATKELDLAAASLVSEYDETDLANARDDVAEDLRLAKQSDPELYGPKVHLLRTAGFVRVAFRLAFWELLHRATFAEAVIDVANRGGDADTNAAITGALFGSYAGADEIPLEWRRLVLDCEPKQKVWGTTRSYHPRVFDCGAFD